MISGQCVCNVSERSLHITSESLHNACCSPTGEEFVAFRARGEKETFTGVSGVLGKAIGRYSARPHMGGGPLV